MNVKGSILFQTSECKVTPFLSFFLHINISCNFSLLLLNRWLLLYLLFILIVMLSFFHVPLFSTISMGMRVLMTLIVATSSSASTKSSLVISLLVISYFLKLWVLVFFFLTLLLSWRFRLMNLDLLFELLLQLFNIFICVCIGISLILQCLIESREIVLFLHWFLFLFFLFCSFFSWSVFSFF